MQDFSYAVVSFPDTAEDMDLVRQALVLGLPIPSAVLELKCQNAGHAESFRRGLQDINLLRKYVIIHVLSSGHS